MVASDAQVPRAETLMSYGLDLRKVDVSKVETIKKKKVSDGRLYKLCANHVSQMMRSRHLFIT